MKEEPVTMTTARISYLAKLQGGSNMTGTDLCVNRPHSCCAVRLVYIQISPGHIWTTLYLRAWNAPKPNVQ